ncbi:2347_t:CDS:2 [Ambispora gerdemannii]|uniref:2347_t:CDS:1 n=1 Tax=Ambispora gerdemannii TaxID=144530 RepID=A0A9N9H1Q4_9GLOM|nr:2347_t:CDS:2 [Ambispora gerdemannii]
MSQNNQLQNCHKEDFPFQQSLQQQLLPALNKVIHQLKEIVWSLPGSPVFVFALSSDVSSESSDLSCEEYYCED